jgi:hypothetical protein
MIGIQIGTAVGLIKFYLTLNSLSIIGAQICTLLFDEKTQIQIDIHEHQNKKQHNCDEYSSNKTKVTFNV